MSEIDKHLKELGKGWDTVESLRSTLASRDAEIEALNRRFMADIDRQSDAYTALLNGVTARCERYRGALEDIADLTNPNELKYIAWPASDYMRKAREALKEPQEETKDER